MRPKIPETAWNNFNLIETGDKNDVFDVEPPHNYEARAIEDIAYLADELARACNHLIDTHGN